MDVKFSKFNDDCFRIIILLPLSRFETILSIICILLVPLQNMTLFHNHLFLTTQRFNVVAVIQLMIGSIQYILMAIFALFAGIYGLFLGILVGNILAILYSRLRLTYKLNIEWDRNIFKRNAFVWSAAYTNWDFINLTYIVRPIYRLSIFRT